MTTPWRTIIMLLSAIALAAVLPACSSDDDDPVDPGDGGDHDTTPPTVTMVDPPDGFVGLQPGMSVMVQFDEPMDPSVDLATEVSTTHGTIEDVSWQGDADLMIQVADLPQATQMILGLGTGFTDVAGNALAEPFMVTYWTWSEILAVLEHHPAAGATNVNRATSVELLFSSEVVATSLATGVTIGDDTKAPVAFSVEEITAYRFRLTPDEPLAATSEITVTVGTEVQSSAGSLDEPYVFTFTTGELLDGDPPTIVAFDPPSGATIPASQTTLTITFSEPIDDTDFAPSFLNGQFAWLLGQAIQEPGFDMDQTVLTVYLPADLPAGLPLEARFAGYADVNGNVQDTETTWTAAIAGSADPYPVWDGRRWIAEGDWAEGTLGNETPSDSGSEMVWLEFRARGTAGQWEKAEFYNDWIEQEYYEIQAVSTSGVDLLGFAESDDFVELFASNPLTFVEFPLTQGNTWTSSATINESGTVLQVQVDGEVIGQEDLAYHFEGFEIAWTDVWRVVLDVDLRVGGTFIGNDLTTFWYAPGVGVIREDYREENHDEDYWYEYDRWMQIDLD